MTGLDYGRMMRSALVGVMADAMGEVARSGLPGDHHFYITVDMRHPGVAAPEWLRKDHPGEMTIVIQHEYGDLEVTGEGFSVTLSFSNRSAMLVIPFDAVQTFADPSAEFGLRFESHVEEDPEEPEEEADAAPPEPDDPSDHQVVSLDQFRKK